MLLMFIGVQLVTMGLLAEMVARTYHESQDKPIYVIREIRQAPQQVARSRRRCFTKMARSFFHGAVCALAALLAGACGGSSNVTGPVTPTTPTSSGAQASNTPPVIDSIAVQGLRARQPGNFADLGEAIAVTAKARDEETAVDQLQYVWTAPMGTFTGSGASVTWQAPASAATPLR